MITKGELIATVAEKTGVTQAAAGASVNAVLDAITAELVKGGEVRLMGFLTLKTVQKAPRMGRNPKTGAKIQIPARKTVSVKVGNALKKAVG